MRECTGSGKWLLAGAAVLALALALRYGVIEAGVLPADCAPGVPEALQGWCAARWVVVVAFMQQRFAWLCLALGLAAFVSRRRPLAWGGWLCGVAGLVLYNFDFAAVGALLSLLVIARGGAKERGSEQQPGSEPRDGLRVGGFH